MQSLAGAAPRRTCHPRTWSEDPSCRLLPTFHKYSAIPRYWTYILASKPMGTLYIGVTNGLIFRVEQHRAGKGSAFTRKYRVHMLVWYEEFADVRQAIQREKALKHYNRDWKINLIERTNPHWADLYPSLPGVAPVPRLDASATPDPLTKSYDVS